MMTIVYHYFHSMNIKKSIVLRSHTPLETTDFLHSYYTTDYSSFLIKPTTTTPGPENVPTTGPTTPWRISEIS